MPAFHAYKMPIAANAPVASARLRAAAIQRASKPMPARTARRHHEQEMSQTGESGSVHDHLHITGNAMMIAISMIHAGGRWPFVMRACTDER